MIYDEQIPIRRCHLFFTGKSWRKAVDIKSQQYDLQQGKTDPKINAIVIYKVRRKGRI